jgi:hypothetical protein
MAMITTWGQACRYGTDTDWGHYLLPTCDTNDIVVAHVRILMCDCHYVNRQ